MFCVNFDILRRHFRRRRAQNIDTNHCLRNTFECISVLLGGKQKKERHRRKLLNTRVFVIDVKRCVVRYEQVSTSLHVVFLLAVCLIDEEQKTNDPGPGALQEHSGAHGELLCRGRESGEQKKKQLSKYYFSTCLPLTSSPSRCLRSTHRKIKVLKWFFKSFCGSAKNRHLMKNHYFI